MLEVLSKETAIEPKKRRLQWRGHESMLPPLVPPATPFKPPFERPASLTIPRGASQNSVVSWVSPPNKPMVGDGFLQRGERARTTERGQGHLPMAVSNTSRLQRSTRAGSAPAGSPKQKESLEGVPSSRAASCPALNPCIFPSPAGQRFERPKLIGLGSFGEVYRVYSPTDRKFYAIKKLRRPFRSNTERARALYEVANHKIISTHHRKKRRRNASPMSMSGCGPEPMRQAPVVAHTVMEELHGHPHCVQYLNHWEQAGHLFIQTEYCPKGALKEYLQVVRLDEITLWKFLGDLALGLSHIHSNGFAHLDLKPENIFITEDGYLKIGDFGTATRREDLHLAEHEGDNAYLAPEMLHRSIGPVSHLTDIFSVGLILYEMAADVDLPSKSGPTWQGLRNNIIPGLLVPGGGPYPTFSELWRNTGWMHADDEFRQGPPCGLADSTSFESVSSEEEMEGDSGEGEWVVIPEAGSNSSSASSSFDLQRQPSPPLPEAVLGLGFPALSIENGQDVCPLTTSVSFTPGTDPVQRDRPARRALFQAAEVAAASFFQAASGSHEFCPVLPSFEGSTTPHLLDSPASNSSTLSNMSNLSTFSYKSGASTTTSSLSMSTLPSHGSSPSSSFSSLYSPPVFTASPSPSEFISRTLMSPKGSGKDGRNNFLRRAEAGPSLSSSRAACARASSMMMTSEQDEASSDEATLSHVSNVLSSVSVELQTLIAQMLNRDPRRRPSAHELLRHPILNRFVRHRTPHAVRKIVSASDTSVHGVGDDAEKENIAPMSLRRVATNPSMFKPRKDMSRAKAAHHRIKSALLDISPSCSSFPPNASFESPAPAKQIVSMPSPHLSPVVPPQSRFGLRIPNTSWLEQGPSPILSKAPHSFSLHGASFSNQQHNSKAELADEEEEDLWTSVTTPHKN
eukprot:gb/GEZN01001264.1/.p1 GENE.gb/GEZN01001264.1/~~gb/GEZN01001264.1/.p1  ORF type:complete len:963 (+),score=119.53 gb/GEZN01001264.1/:159-2891(+)